MADKGESSQGGASQQDEGGKKKQGKPVSKQSGRKERRDSSNDSALEEIEEEIAIVEEIEKIVADLEAMDRLGILTMEVIDKAEGRLSELYQLIEENVKTPKQHFRYSPNLIKRILSKSKDTQYGGNQTDDRQPRASQQRVKMESRILAFIEATEEKFPRLMNFYKKQEKQIECRVKEKDDGAEHLDKRCLMEAAVQAKMLLQNNPESVGLKVLITWKIVTLTYVFLETCVITVIELQVLEDDDPKNIEPWLRVLSDWYILATKLDLAMTNFSKAVQGTDTLVNKCQASLSQFKSEFDRCLKDLMEAYPHLVIKPL